MTTKKQGELLIFIIGILLICIILRLFPTIQLSGVKDIMDTMEEVEVTKVETTVDELKKDKKNKKKKYTVENNTVYEDISKNDKKEGINYNAVVDVVNMEMETEVKPLPDNLFDWENYEPNLDDLILPDNLKDEHESK
jgi:molybdopterin converting factor small subunit